MSLILNAFKSKQPFLLLLLPFILTAFWLKWFSNPVINIDASGLMPFSHFLVDCLKDSPVYLGVLSIIISLITAYTIYYVVETYNLLRVGNNLPSFIYILLAGSIPVSIGFNPIIFSALFILIAFVRLMRAYSDHVSMSYFFDAGFFIGLAAGFYLQSILFIFFVLIGVMTIGRFNLRELLAVITGVLLPFAAMWTYSFYNDSLVQLYGVFNNISVLPSVNELPSVYEWTLIALILLLFTISTSSLFLRNQLNEVFEIKCYTMLFLILLVCFAFVLFFYPSGIEILLVAAIPISLFIGRFFAVQKHKWYGDILFVLMLVSVIILQFPTLLKMIYPHG